MTEATEVHYPSGTASVLPDQPQTPITGPPAGFQGPADIAKAGSRPLLAGWGAGTSRGWYATVYSMAEALGLRRFHDYLQGSSTMSFSSSPLWLLGVAYQDSSATEDGGTLPDKVMSDFYQDFASRLWMTYRRDFPPLGAHDLTTDAGWGCTLRTGQMLLAEALLRHHLGRGWRLAPCANPPAALLQLLRRFWDNPASQHTFSVHNLCAAGKPHGVCEGQWLGPWVLCRTLETVVNQVQPGGLRLHVAYDAGGGAPVLYTLTVRKLFGVERPAGPAGDSPGDSAAAADSRDAVEVTEPPQASPGPDRSAEQSSSLVILIPLVLGIGKVNPTYLPQLRAVLTFPQSIGIVGGRPSSSLFFLGYQDASVVYLDPHHIQQASVDSMDVETFRCMDVRCMLLASIDPSLAIGFYCRGTGDFDDLCRRLTKMEQESAGAPLLSVAKSASAWCRPAGDDAGAGGGDQGALHEAEGAGEKEWEFV